MEPGPDGVQPARLDRCAAQSHERLLGLVGPLTPEQLGGQSYYTDWSIAQVLSHLGSGAEIAMMILPGALGQAEPVEPGGLPAGLGPVERHDRRRAGRRRDLTDDSSTSRRWSSSPTRNSTRISFDFFGMMTLDAVGLVRLRLGEHALHTWDVAVVARPRRHRVADAVELLIDNVPQFLAPRLGKALDPAFKVRIKTTDPDRDYLLTAAEPMTMERLAGRGRGRGRDADAAEATHARRGAAAAGLRPARP